MDSLFDKSKFFHLKELGDRNALHKEIFSYFTIITYSQFCFDL